MYIFPQHCPTRTTLMEIVHTILVEFCVFSRHVWPFLRMAVRKLFYVYPWNGVGSIMCVRVCLLFNKRLYVHHISV